MIKVTRKEEDIKCDECGETYLATFEVTLADITIHLCIMCIMEFFGHFKPHVGV